MVIIPEPKKVIKKEGKLSLNNIGIIVNSSDIRISHAAVSLQKLISETTGSDIKLSAGSKPCTGERSVFINDRCTKLSGEQYHLKVTDSGIEIRAGSSVGAYWGIQTFRQMISEYKKNIPLCEIKDEPDYADRGFYHDITRGRVPTLSKLKEIALTLSEYKYNSLQLYTEDSFDFIEYKGIIDEGSKLTSSEISELDDFCYDHFIELVPSLSCFGHLYNLLQSDKYKYLCELSDYKPSQLYWIEKMAHHTIDVSNDDSIKLIESLIDQYIPLFRSNKFNICCDETFDLCRGKNRGKDTGTEYFNFVSKIIKHLKSKGKTVMMWGDIALQHPEKLSLLPSDTIMLNWDYSADPSDSNVIALEKAGAIQYECPGTSTWNNFVEDVDVSVPNISRMAENGYEHGAKGFLVTNWGDYGNICAFNTSLYSMAVASEKSWNTGSPIDKKFEKKASSLIYGSTRTNVPELIRELSECERACEFGRFVGWYSANTIEKRPFDLPANKTKLESNIKKCSEIRSKLEKTGDNFIYSDLILASEGIEILSRIYLKRSRISENDKNLYADTCSWIKKYRKAWLRDDKSSQIVMIEKFFKKNAK